MRPSPPVATNSQTALSIRSDFRTNKFRPIGYWTNPVMHTYYAKESPIPPPTIVASFYNSLSSNYLILNNSFFRRNYWQPKKQGHNQSFSSTFALPQEFEMGESSRKTSLEHHEEQIEEILNHLDELSLDRIEHIEDKIEGLGKGRNKSSKKSSSAALEAQAANMENTDNTTRPREAPVARQCSFKEFMSCQPINFKGTEGAIGLICWFERTEFVFSLQKIEDEFYHLTVKGNDLKTYVRRFQEFSTLCPTTMQDSEKMMEVFIEGLPRSIEGNVTASKP
ncbi:hypothetical protein Tco_0614979 [Tanacetum coccineum]